MTRHITYLICDVNTHIALFTTTVKGRAFEALEDYQEVGRKVYLKECYD